MKLKFFCINLEKRPDRWALVEQEFKKIWLDVERFYACDLPEERRFGCSLSHRKIIEYAKNKKYNHICVFEDDIFFYNPEKFLENLHFAISELPEKWAILYLGGLIGREGKIEKYSPHLLKVQRFMCTYGIIYNKNIYDTILRSIPCDIKSKWKKTYINKHKVIDMWLSEEVQYNHECFVTNALLVSERPNYSDLEKRWKSTERHYKFRFMMYKNGFWGLLKKIWQIGDWFKISTRIRHRF